MGIGLNSAPDEALATKRELAEAPPMWQVVLLNDDYTPMEFVILVLQKFFGKGREQAIQIMLRVHNEGRSVCGVYPRDVAATRVVQVCQYAREQQHPLQCIMEQA
jgi:ATP-dependent Clp protease adaptor protein ClpS